MRLGKSDKSLVPISRRDLSSGSLTGVTCDDGAWYGMVKCDKLRDTTDGLPDINGRNVCWLSSVGFPGSPTSSKEVR